MRTQWNRAALTLTGLTVAVVGINRPALGNTWINSGQGKVDLASVGVVYSYVHENVPAGTSVTIETFNLANSSATGSYVDTVVHVADRDTRQPVASNDDCGQLYSSCVTLPADSVERSYVIYVHAYGSHTHGTAQLTISHDGTAQVDVPAFSFGGHRVYTTSGLPMDSLAFTTGYSSPPLGTRLLLLSPTNSMLAVDDNEGAMGFSNMHLPAALGAYGSFLVGAHGGLVQGGPPDTAGVSLHWDVAMNYMWPLQKKVEDTAYEILREAAQSPDGRWFVAFNQAFGGRLDWDDAAYLKDVILQGGRFPVALEFVAPSVLMTGQGQALAAFTPNKIFISTALSDTYTAGNVFIEELAHYFDYNYGGAGDAPGDEGHIFWSYIVGEQLTPAELSELQTMSDAGTICVNGTCYAVEFLGLPKWLKKVFGTVWSGVKTGSGWVWSGATTVGGALQTAANATWNGSQVLGGWIAEGAAVAAEKSVEYLKRAGWAGVDQFKITIDAIHGVGLGIYDGAKIMKEGYADLARGNFKDGIAAIFVGMAKMAVEAPISSMTAVALQELSTLQMLLFLEPVGRGYTPQERAVIDWVFWNNSPWWAWRVQIKEGPTGIFGVVSPRAFTLQSDIYLKKVAYGWPAAAKMDLVVHESTHVWQWWNGGSSYILDSLWYQGRHYLFGGPDPYHWKPAVDSGTQWPNLSAENQAQFVESAYASGCYNFAGCSIGGNYDAYFSNVDFHIINGSGAP